MVRCMKLMQSRNPSSDCCDPAESVTLDRWMLGMDTRCLGIFWGYTLWQTYKKTMENHHAIHGKNPLFLWPFSSSQTVNVYQRVLRGLSLESNEM